MGHPIPNLDRTRLEAALRAVLDHSLPACAAVEYRLVGTGAALLQGVDLPAADVDLLFKDRQGVEAFSQAMGAFPCLGLPGWLADTRQYYANYTVNGVEVGLSTVEIESGADTIETFGRGPWEHFVWLTCGPYSVPTVALELRLITELYRGRPDRSEPILQYMQAHGCDMALIRRGLEALGFSPDVQVGIIDRLADKPAAH